MQQQLGRSLNLSSFVTDDDLEKGEGSKGGHVIGHTKSGKAIYGTKSAKEHTKFTPKDHQEAADAFHAIAMTKSGGDGGKFTRDAARRLRDEHAVAAQAKGGVEKSEDDELIKGEGDKGGKIIGHTKSGKAIYASGGDTKGFSREDHHWAWAAHSNAATAAKNNADARGETKDGKGGPHTTQHDAHKKAADQHSAASLKMSHEEAAKAESSASKSGSFKDKMSAMHGGSEMGKKTAAMNEKPTAATAKKIKDNASATKADNKAAGEKRKANGGAGMHYTDMNRAELESAAKKHGIEHEGMKTASLRSRVGDAIIDSNSKLKKSDDMDISKSEIERLIEETEVAYPGVEVLTTEEFHLKYNHLEGPEIYSAQAIANFTKSLDTIALAIEDEEEREEFEKSGHKDISKLTRKIIIDHNGKQTTVLVNLNKDESSAAARALSATDPRRLASQIQQVVDGGGGKSDKIRALYALGVHDKHHLAAITSANYSQVHSIVKAHEMKAAAEGDAGSGGGSGNGPGMGSGTGGSGGSDQGDGGAPEADDDVIEAIKALRLPTLSVDERWESYETYVQMVADGTRKSAIAYGRGGVGKTYTLMQVLKGNGMKGFDEDVHTPIGMNNAAGGSEDDPDEGDDEDYSQDQDDASDGFVPIPASNDNDYDYVTIGGKSTTTDLYKQLYLHNGKLLVFDDCDSVLLQPDSINILKKALDTTGDGTVSYGSAKAIKEGDMKIPQRFKFNGTVIFVSNLDKEKMPQPLRSRSLCVDLTMSAHETIDRMRKIVQKMPFQGPKGNDIEVSAEDRSAAVDFLDKYKDAIDIDNLNGRTLGSIALVKRQVDINNKANGTNKDWEKMAAALLG